MLIPPIPVNEPERLESLRRLQILDTPAEERFDRITRIVARAFGVPIALVSLIDHDRQWFKSCIGLEVAGSDRSISFCGHAILGEAPLIVPDALQDERFADNPLVTDDPHIRFYAGHPLRSADGHALGTLCLIDRRPRLLDAGQLALLADLAAWAEEEINSIGLTSALAAQQASQTRLEAITEAVGDGLVTIDQDGLIRSFNLAAERIFGYARTEVTGRDVTLLLHGPCRDEAAALVARCLGGATRSADACHRELMGRRADGGVFPVDLTLSQMRLGGSRNVIATLRDITERRRAEETRRSFFALSRDLLCIAGADGYFTDLNPAWTSTLGHTREAMLAVPFIEFVHPDDRERTLAEAARLACGEDSVSFENRYRTADGGYRWLLWSATTGLNDGHIYAVARDVTDRRASEEALAREIAERRRAEAALRKSEEIHRSVIAAMGEGIVVQEQGGQITACNDAAERILGLTADQMMGRTSMDPRWRAVRLDGTPYAGADHPSMVTLATGRPCSDEIMGVHTPDGQLRWVSINSRPLQRPGEARPHAAVATFADITERMAIDRMKDEFVSTVSHELRTPLTSIRGALGLVSAGTLGALPDRVQRMLEIAVTNTDRLIRLINDILDIERMESGQVQLLKQDTDALDLIRQAAEVVRGMADRAGVAIEVDGRHAALWVDPDRIVQALTNLLGNAVKFSPEGTLVRAMAEVEGGEVVFRVADQGRGIPTDKVGTIFERFQQVDATDSRDKGGTGLGLAITRSIVEQHGGRIWVESVEGEGSTFSFVLPRLVGSDSAGPRKDPAAELAPCVLLCDDDPSIREVVQTLLQDHGYRVVAAETGERALQMAVSDPPDAILLDLGLPGIDGWSVLADLREDRRTGGIPVIIFSASARTPGAPPSAAALEWVDKPFDPGSLLGAIGRALDARLGLRRIMLLGDHGGETDALVGALRSRGVEVCRSPGGEEAVALCAEAAPDLVVLNASRTGDAGVACMEALREQGHLPAIPVLVYAGEDLSRDERERLRLGGDTRFVERTRTDPAELGRLVADMLVGAAPPRSEAP